MLGREYGQSHWNETTLSSRRQGIGDQAEAVAVESVPASLEEHYLCLSDDHILAVANQPHVIVFCLPLPEAPRELAYLTEGVGPDGGLKLILPLSPVLSLGNLLAVG